MSIESRPIPFVIDDTRFRVLTLDDIDEGVVDIIETVVDGWFMDDPMPRDELLDRVEDMLGDDGGAPRREWCLDIRDIYDDPVAKRIVAVARKYKRENR